jgi:hypothetical protein
MFPSSGEGRETPTLFGPLERANSNLWTSDSESNTQSSEPFRFYFTTEYFTFVYRAVQYIVLNATLKD